MNKVDYLNNFVRVEEVLKQSPYEKTEKIYIVDRKGKREGPFIRKIIKDDAGLGEIYKVMLKEKDISIICDNVPNVFYAEKENNSLVVIEQYYQGLTLDKFLAKNNFDIKLFNKIFIQVCNAVDYLHTGFNKPIIHRDIKPENILVDESNSKVMLIDFGIARSFDENTDSDTHKFGTKGYAAPEQFGYSQTDARSDVYSLGKVLEFMMDGSHWADGKAEMPNSIYDEIRKKAIEFDPAKRYKTVNTVMIEFSSAAKGGKWIQRLSDNKSVIILGHIWNLLITLIYIFFIVATILVAINPGTESIMEMSVGEKIVYCIMTIVFIMYPIYFIFLFKPSLRKIFKSLPRLKFLHYLAFAIACSSVVLILGLIGQLL